jgi:DNA polymerase I-like protein with 3'-5' exonuclease and polymerase domains
MARILTLQEAKDLPSGQEKDWAYNALDVTGTREVADVILPRLNEHQEKFYAFELALQAPAQAMMQRGILIDGVKRQRMITELKRELNKDLAAVAKLPEIISLWDLTEKNTGTCPIPQRKDGKHKWEKWEKGAPEHGRTCTACGASRLIPKPFNANSSDHVDHLVYDLLNVPIYTNKKGLRSLEGDILERIANKYTKFAPLIDRILAVRDKKKQLGTLQARLSPDGRYPSSFNIGAAWTGRQSSSKNPFGEGGNAQNLAPRHRGMFIADAGKLLVYADLKQAESNVVAHVAGDQVYIDAHASGDVHTYVARLVWPELPWNGDLKKDKSIAKRLPEWDPVEGHDFRFQAKRIQHGSNFGLTPAGIAMIARIPMKAAYSAQENYFSEFSFIRAWQNEIARKVKNHESLYNVLGRQFDMLGRPWDPHTVKQALSAIPQSSVADILDLGMWRVWRYQDPTGGEREDLELLAQIHDAILGQFEKGRLDVLHETKRLMQIPIKVKGLDNKVRVMQIEAEIAIGYNWGKKSESNPRGMYEPPELNE